MRPSFLDMQQSDDDKAELIAFAKCPKGFLLLAGSNGSGKSYAAMCIYRVNSSLELPQWNPDEALFINQSELNEKWLNSDRKEWSEWCKDTRLLVIDDLGTRRPSDAFADFLYAIIDYRWNEREVLGTIITTNLNSQTMREMFGSAIISRIASGIVKRWDHPDRRCKEF